MHGSANTQSMFHVHSESTCCDVVVTGGSRHGWPGRPILS